MIARGGQSRGLARLAVVPTLDVPKRVLELLVALATSAAVGLAAVTFGSSLLLTVPVALAIWLLVREPAASTVATLVIASLLGSAGAHYLVPGAGLPVIEVMLAIASLIAVARLVASREQRQAIDLRLVLPWLPAAAWGLFLVATVNRGSLISGVRDAMILIYPTLIAIPVSTLSGDRLREILDRRMRWVLGLGIAVTLLGLYYALTNQSVVTSSGQLRWLGSTYAAPLFAGFVAALYLHERGRLSDLRTFLLASVPVLAFLLVNHRSAYVAFILATLLYIVVRARAHRTGSPRMWRLTTAGVAAVLIVLVATPVGRAGLARLASTGDRNDPNVTDRLRLTEHATELHGRQWILGAGVGLYATDLRNRPERQDDPAHYGVHNSFISSLNTGGLVGLLLLLAPIAWTMRAIIRRRGDPLVRGILAVGVFAIVMALFNVILENGYGSVWVWLPLTVGASIAMARSEQADAAPADPDPSPAST